MKTNGLKKRGRGWGCVKKREEEKNRSYELTLLTPRVWRHLAWHSLVLADNVYGRKKEREISMSILPPDPGFRSPFRWNEIDAGSYSQSREKTKQAGTSFGKRNFFCTKFSNVSSILHFAFICEDWEEGGLQEVESLRERRSWWRKRRNFLPKLHNPSNNLSDTSHRETGRKEALEGGWKLNYRTHFANLMA